MVRIKRLAQAGKDMSAAETMLAEEFERDNLSLYDGIIAVSALDKQLFAETYQYPAERIEVIENSVDLAYFHFQARDQHEQKNIVYVGTLIRISRMNRRRYGLSTVLCRSSA